MVNKLVNVRLGEYSLIFAELGVNNCFSIVIQVIIRQTRKEPKNVNFICLRFGLHVNERLLVVRETDITW